jgi:amidophosphoribosyltransferase
LGKVDGGYVLASETCALDIVGAEFVRDIKPGECCVIQAPKGPVSFEKNLKVDPALCIFELIYFARPDSELSGLLVDEARVQMGRELAKEHPLDVDIVIPVPDSGVPAAMGYAEELGVKYTSGIIKNRYVTRTFILPDQHLRDLGIRLKLNPQRRRLAGKRIAIVDDSIVRGTTSSKIVKMLRDAGAKEVHMLVSCPPIRYPCYYGIDTTGRGDLIAADKDQAEICRYIGADSLNFLSMEGLLKATRNGDSRGYCTACFDCNYPIPLQDDLKVGKLDLEEVLK